MRTATSCHRCSVPVLPVASSCPWCGVPEPGDQPFTGTVLGAWLLAGGVGLSVAAVLLDALGKAIG